MDSKTENKVQVCTRCVMDSTDKDIEFDEHGICNYCRKHDRWIKKQSSDEEKTQGLEKYINKIRESGKNKKYDCIIGLSGGVDSSYVAHLAKVYELKPMVVHLDNGWNSEQAVNNIKNIVSKCNFDLNTHVINWEEFKDLQRAFFKASVIDIEMLTDHAISVITQRIAWKYKIKYVITGANIATEFCLPSSWNYLKMDYFNIKAIHRKYGEKKIKTFPLGNLFTLLNKVYNLGFGLKVFKILNYINYVKKDAKEFLIKEYGWKDYGGKHYESIFTKFYQAYYLPYKFNVDKRKAHLSSLILSGQISREDAVKELENSLYDKAELQIEKDYVLKKLEFTQEEFEEILHSPPKSHFDYPNIYGKIIYLTRLKRKILGQPLK